MRPEYSQTCPCCGKVVHSSNLSSITNEVKSQIKKGTEVEQKLQELLEPEQPPSSLWLCNQCKGIIDSTPKYVFSKIRLDDYGR